MFLHKLKLMGQKFKLTSLRYMTCLTSGNPWRPRTSARLSICSSPRFISVHTLCLFFGFRIFMNGVVTENFYWLYRLPDHLDLSERKHEYIGKWISFDISLSVFFFTKVGEALRGRYFNSI